MSEERNGKAKVWIYAVVLFTSAFIVLLLTAFSQIKFNKNINEYKNQITDKETEKGKFQLNLNYALEENKKLSEENEKLKEEMKENELILENQISEAESLNKVQQATIESYENLLLAENKYENKDYAYCAEILSNKIKPDHLSEEGNKKYNFLLKESIKKAPLQLYTEGKILFSDKKYQEAIGKFTQSVKLSEAEYFSDDCYYYIILSEYKLGNNEAVKGNIKILMQKYPKSGYIDIVKNFVK